MRGGSSWKSPRESRGSRRRVQSGRWALGLVRAVVSVVGRNGRGC